MTRMLSRGKSLAQIISAFVVGASFNSTINFMTDKFDKQSKAQNNLNQDLKDEITDLNQKVSKL